MDPDGGNVVNITRTTDVSETDPDWSPNGDRIVFTAYRNKNMDIYVMDANGNNVERLTSHPKRDFSACSIS